MEGQSKNASLVDLHSGMILVGRADSSFRMCMHYADACALACVFARRVRSMSKVLRYNYAQMRTLLYTTGEKMFKYI